MDGVDRPTDVVGKLVADRLVDMDYKLAAGVDRLAAGVDRLAAEVDRPAVGVDRPAAGVERPAAGVERLAAGVEGLVAGVGWHLGKEEFLRKLGQDHLIFQVQYVALVGWVD